MVKDVNMSWNSVPRLDGNIRRKVDRNNSDSKATTALSILKTIWRSRNLKIKIKLIPPRSLVISKDAKHAWWWRPEIVQRNWLISLWAITAH